MKYKPAKKKNTPSRTVRRGLPNRVSPIKREPRPFEKGYKPGSWNRGYTKYA